MSFGRSQARGTAAAGGAGRRCVGGNDGGVRADGPPLRPAGALGAHAAGGRVLYPAVTVDSSPRVVRPAAGARLSWSAWRQSGRR